MRTTLLTSIISLCCASAGLAADTTEYEYALSTSNGVGSNNGGGYTSVKFQINANSLNVDNYEGKSVTDASYNDLAESNITINTGDTLALNSITLTGRSGYTVDFENTTVSITVDNVTYTGTWTATESVTYITDPVTGTVYTNNYQLGTYSFEGLNIKVGTQYTINLSAKTQLSATLGGDDGFLLETKSEGTYSNPMTINTTLISTVTPNNAIPEPATATLSLVALAGLMIRRRRQA